MHTYNISVNGSSVFRHQRFRIVVLVWFFSIASWLHYILFCVQNNIVISCILYCIIYVPNGLYYVTILSYNILIIVIVYCFHIIITSLSTQKMSMFFFSLKTSCEWYIFSRFSWTFYTAISENCLYKIPI